MTHLYPAIQPYRCDRIETGDGHTLHVEQSGNENGYPVLFIHGGPGGGLTPIYRSLFNPDIFRIISFDQRGCGQSTPFASTENNTTHHLLSDIDAIRKFANVKKWIVCGGSWGATLALLNAISKPKTVSGLVLRGTFLARDEDYDWYMGKNGAAAQMFPEHYAHFVEVAGNPGTTKALTEQYYQLLTSGNELEKTRATKAWSLWEHQIASLHANVNEQDISQHLHVATSLALLECHYVKHRCFIDDNYILNNIHKISHIPGTIVHGRYDMVCKLNASHALSEVWKNGQLLVVPEAGHCLSETKIAEAVCHANDAMIKFIQEEK
ncbi:prolyl aminopeptidase [Aestuariibacter sp. AA17]|uniref:Proline iminopeptidase n=1 Tax=Fluctibacter corallii TaxID=2984329 RepID=A0ABT3A7K3_9ALTE|nr:prolyl aminopeptidase [Aestuariibacter sp. AA17]MCV2884296.1 prolyl aminopeptidase [Aestuariibacter sp. AA17]